MIFTVFFLLSRVTTRISRDCIAQYVVGHLRTVAEARSVSHHSKLLAIKYTIRVWQARWP